MKDENVEGAKWGTKMYGWRNEGWNWQLDILNKLGWKKNEIEKINNKNVYIYVEYGSG